MGFTSYANKYKTIADEVDSWCKEEYQKHFASYFQIVEKLYSRMSSKYTPITDEELEEILTTLPLQLFEASESLNSLKVRKEVISLQIKKDKLDQTDSDEISKELKKELKAQKEIAAIESSMVLKAYDSIIDTVSRQMAYSRELIMSAKKIWSTRKEADEIANASQGTVVEELPDYEGYTAQG